MKYTYFTIVFFVLNFSNSFGQKISVINETTVTYEEIEGGDSLKKMATDRQRQTPEIGGVLVKTIDSIQQVHIMYLPTASLTSIEIFMIESKINSLKIGTHIMKSKSDANKIIGYGLVESKNNYLFFCEENNMLRMLRKTDEITLSLMIYGNSLQKIIAQRIGRDASNEEVNIKENVVLMEEESITNVTQGDSLGELSDLPDLIVLYKPVIQVLDPVSKIHVIYIENMASITLLYDFYQNFNAGVYILRSKKDKNIIGYGLVEEDETGIWFCKEGKELKVLKRTADNKTESPKTHVIEFDSNRSKRGLSQKEATLKGQ